MSERTWKRGTIVSTIAVALLFFISLLVGGVVYTGKADANGDGNTPPPAPSAETIAALTITSTSVKCSDMDVKTVEDKRSHTVLVSFNEGALKGTPPRKWSDALSTPLSGASSADKVKAVQAAICTGPLYGSAVANMFANLRVGDVSVGSLNPWLSPFAETSDINDQAASYMPLLNKTDPSTSQVTDAVKQNVEWQEVAEKLGTLVSRFQVSGVQSLTSVQNWHLSGGGVVADGLPEVSLDSQQDKQSVLVLKLTQKNACAPLKVIGFNIGDKRPEVFPTPSCKKPRKPSTPPSKTTTTPSKTTTTTPPSTTTTTPSTTTTTPPSKTTTTPSKTTCSVCVTKPSASQTVPTPAKQTSTSVPTTAPTPAPGQSSQTADPTHTAEETFTSHPTATVPIPDE